jgi:hypothetical protein
MTQGEGQSGQPEGTFQRVVVFKYEHHSFVYNKAIATLVHFLEYFLN